MKAQPLFLIAAAVALGGCSSPTAPTSGALAFRDPGGSVELGAAREAGIYHVRATLDGDGFEIRATVHGLPGWAWRLKLDTTPSGDGGGWDFTADETSGLLSWGDAYNGVPVDGLEFQSSGSSLRVRIPLAALKDANGDPPAVARWRLMVSNETGGAVAIGTATR